MRIRTIKPEFWTDATMVQLPLLSRLLFIGLWNCADDHGYLDDEVDRIAMQILPREDPLEVGEALDLLIATGRIDRLVDEGGETFLRVTNWEKHQRVDRPSESKVNRPSSRKAVVPAEERRRVAIKYGCKPGGRAQVECFFCSAPGSIWWPELRNGKPSGWVAFAEVELSHFIAENQGGETTSENIVLACRRCNRRMATKDGVATLLANVREPSRALAPERKGKEGKGTEGKGTEGKGTVAGATPHPLQAVWNELKAPDQPKWAETSDARKKRADARWRERDDWPEVVRRIAASGFCRGQNDRGWRADPDWLLKPETATRVLEGRYDNRAGAVKPGAFAQPSDWAEVEPGEVQL